MCNHVRACMNEAKDLFVRKLDDDFNFCWSLPDDVDSTWREVIEHVICFNLQNEAKSILLVKTVHPQMPFDPRLLLRFCHVLAHIECANAMDRFGRLDGQIAKSIELLNGWVVMRRHLQKPADPSSQDSQELGEAHAKKQQASDDDLVRAIKYCDSNGLKKKTHVILLRIIRDEFNLTCGKDRIQEMYNRLHRPRRSKE